MAGGGTRWLLCARSPGSAHVAGAEQGEEGRGGGWPPTARDPAPSTGHTGVQQRPPGCSRDPLGAFPWASCARVLCPSLCQLCARSPRSCVGVAWVPAQSSLWLSTMRWQRVLVGHGGLPGELWPGTEGSVQGRRQGAGCRKGRSRPRVCLLEDLAPGPCPWGCSHPMLPCLCRCSDGHHGHQQGEV